MRVIVMGVSGSGKTTFGKELARELGARFIEGDQLHPPANVAKMSAGSPLTDADRWPWLNLVGLAVAEGAPAVASCSALRRVYRDRLREAVGTDLRFVCLTPPRSALELRMAKRQDHFMPAGLLDSQLAAFEPPSGESDALIVAGRSDIKTMVDRAVLWIRMRETGSVRD